MIAGAEGEPRRLGQGDRVTKGQLLAIVWSSELSQIKNALLDAFSRVSLERETIARLGGLRKEGAISARDYQEARRELEESEIEAARQERSLRARGATAEDIAAVQAEAETVHARGGRSPFNPEKSWARFSIRSPIDGRILDARAADGDTVEADEVVYQVADLGRLLVHVAIHESDLPAVEAHPPPRPLDPAPRGPSRRRGPRRGRRGVRRGDRPGHALLDLDGDDREPRRSAPPGAVAHGHDRDAARPGPRRDPAIGADRRRRPGPGLRPARSRETRVRPPHGPRCADRPRTPDRPRRRPGGDQGGREGRRRGDRATQGDPRRRFPTFLGR